jgi:alpha-1,6-mannosyltransferase
MSRIVQVANFVGPRSGGIRTVLAHLAHGYAAAGHDVLQIIPGSTRKRTSFEWGERLELPGYRLPGTGYQVMAARPVAPALAAFAADRIEVHDRATLRGLGIWARRADIPACVVSHERLDRLAEQWTRGRLPTRRLADTSNRRLADQFDSVVCTSAWAAEEFIRIRVPNLNVVPLGVDTARFGPHAADPVLRRRYAPAGGVLLAMAIRLSPEKQPGIGIEAVRQLLDRGRPVQLVIAGDGPLRTRLERSARGLPVTFLGHIDTARLAALLASADVALAPGPVETFGLAALEALASGTPVVVNKHSALPSLVGEAGRAADTSGSGFADAVEALLAEPPARLATAARNTAVQFGWGRTVRGFLDVHGLPTIAAVA